MARREKKDSVYYVDKEHFTRCVIAEAREIRTAIANGDELPQISDYVAECIFKICTKLSNSGKFRSYTFLEEMVGDSIVDCVAAVKNFDPEAKTRSGKPNAFGYFTQVAWFAFLRRINTEKKQWAKQNKIRSTLTVHDFGDHIDTDDKATQILNRYIEEQVSFQTKKDHVPES